MEKKMETTIKGLYRVQGYVGRMEKKMETTMIEGPRSPMTSSLGSPYPSSSRLLGSKSGSLFWVGPLGYFSHFP